MKNLFLAVLVTFVYLNKAKAHEDILSITDNNDNNEVYNLVVEVNDKKKKTPDN